MKMQEHKNTLQTNVHNETQNFGIGDASVVIEILRNRLYENKVQTLVQEYICNARDAMREVGKGNTFEVTVPTLLNPVFKVRDFGPGISQERMVNVFILYGASTKRGSNNQTGGFGIGAKSAWSYTDSFTVVTTVDGVKRSYVAHTGVNNNGRLDLVSTEQTKEPNGTEIQVAVQRNDINEFRDSILRAIYFWEERPTLKGQLDVPTTIEGYKVGQVEILNSQLLPSYTGENYESKPLIIIDGVPYSVSQKLLDKCKTLQRLTEFTRRKLIFRIGNGVVEVSASRESIADSPKSIEAIEKMAQKAAMEVKTHIHQTFGAVKTPHEYVETYQELNDIFKVESGFAKFKNYAIAGGYVVSDVFHKVKMTEINCLGRYGRGKVNKISRKEKTDPTLRKIDLDLFNHVFFTRGGESAVSVNKRVRAYFEKPNHTRLLLLEVDTVPGSGVADLDKVVKDLNVKEFQTITYVVVPKAERIKISREKTEFCLHVLDGSRYKYTTLADNTQKWFYVPVTENGWEYNTDQLKDLSSYLMETQNVRICGVADRAQKMVDGNANFSPLKDYLDSYKPSKKEVRYTQSLGVKNKDYMPTLLGVKGIDDTELGDLIEEYRLFEKNSIQVLPEILLKKVKEEKEVKDFATRDESVAKLIKKQYSLLDELTGYYTRKNAQEVAYYLNAKFSMK